MPSGAGGAGATEALVGRAVELAALDGLLAHAAGGRGAFVTVSGPAGIGKSRIVDTLVAERAAGATVRVAACSIGAGPLAPWRTLLAGDLPRARRGHRDVLAQEPALAASVVLTAVRALDAPVLLVLDDLHLADDASRSLLGHVVEEVAAAPLLVVGTVRTPRTGTTAAVPLPLPDHDVTIGGLGAADVAELVRRRASDLPRDRLGRLVEALLAETGGNPLLLLARLALDAAVAGPPPTDGASAGTAGGPRPPAADVTVLEALARLEPSHRDVLATAAIAGDLPEAMLARHAGVALDDLARAVAAAQGLGLVGGGAAGRRRLHARVAELLLEGLGREERVARHARLARALAGDRAVSPGVVAHHALAAAAILGDDEVASAALAGGRTALAEHAFGDADRLFAAAEERLGEEDAARLEVLLGRARARLRLGDLPEAYRVAEAAARLAEAREEADAFAEAATLLAYPPDWREDDAVARELLARADAAPTSPTWRARVRATRARMEMRSVIVRDADGRSWHWATHADLAQPMADEALRLARESGEPATLALALLAWRSNHRAPRFLTLRRQATDEAVRLAGRLGDAALLAEAALRAFVDRIESGDRAAADEAARVVTAAAERAVEPRFRWRAMCLEAVQAGLDGDLAAMRRHRERAVEFGAASAVPGVAAGAALLVGQELILSDAFVALRDAFGDEHVAAAHPLWRAGAAVAAAATGDEDRARRLLDALPELLDEEASLLAVAGIAARAAVTLGDAARAERWLEVLEPWRDLAAIDAEAMLVPFPVASVTARIHDLLGDVDAARRARERARELAASLRSSPRAALIEPLAEAAVPTDVLALTPRQLAVLRRLAAGRTNPEIAEDLHFGVATIARETSALYRLLGATNRADAVREATRRGLLA